MAIVSSKGHLGVIGKYAALASSALRRQGVLKGVGQLASQWSFDRRHGLSAFLPREIRCEEGEPGFRLADAVQYQGVDPGLALDVLKRLPMGLHSDATFVDYGCGKGRGLAVGILAGFRQLIGVEVSRDLAALAGRNLQALRERHPGVRIQIQTMDATRFQPPEGPLVVFLYNPFVGLTLERVVQRLAHHATRSPVHVVYINPRGRSAFLDHGFRQRVTWPDSQALILESGVASEVSQFRCFGHRLMNLGSGLLEPGQILRQGAGLPSPVHGNRSAG
jgi:predicted RNA methylase